MRNVLRHQALFCSLALSGLSALGQKVDLTGVPSMAYLDKIPPGTLSEMSDATKAVGFPKLSWPIPTVNVAFNGGDPELYALIESTASEWTSNGGRLKFSFRRSDGTFRTWSESDSTRAADVRIGFFTDKDRNGYWSAVGTLARRVNAGEATMNFGDLGTTLSAYYGGKNPTPWLKSYAHSTILHEFGHAIGLNHEHFHPQCQADIKLTETVNWLMGPPNEWSRQQAMYNMDATTYFKSVAAKPNITPEIDKASVMLYSFQDSFYTLGVNSPCRPSGPLHYATDLSAGDRYYYAASYGPKH